MEIDLGLKGKNVLLFGGHSNIGQYCTVAFGMAGAQVTIACRDTESGERVAREAAAAGAPRADVVECDATSYEQTEAASDFARQFGDIDCVYHGVSWDAIARFEEIPRADWDRIYEVNLKSVMNAWRHILPIMRGQGHGNFINMASVMGREHALEEPIYGAMKSALIHLAQTLAIEYGKDGIRINVIAPGPTPPVDREMITSGSPWHEFLGAEAAMEQWKTYSPLGQYGNPVDSGWAALYLASDVTGRHLTGQIIGLDGGWYMPK
jgi:NAD(P)-dependent dehydrogenase (short-subunit alcohol dehydrogenase family)